MVLSCILICTFFITQLTAQETDVTIIGVIHTANKVRNTELLLEILKKEKPDVLLSETDTVSGYFTDRFTMVTPPSWYITARKLGLAKKMPPEMDMLYRYQAFNPNVIIHPFDHTIINRKKFVHNQETFEQQWTTDLNKAYDRNEIPDNLAPQHKIFISYNNYLYNLYEEDYMTINRPVVTDSLRKLMQIEYEHVSSLMKIVPRLKKYGSQFMDQHSYWKTRNEIMSQNILDFISMYKGRKIIVLTGILHKYYLEDLLSKYQTNKEFKLNNLTKDR